MPFPKQFTKTTFPAIPKFLRHVFQKDAFDFGLQEQADEEFWPGQQGPVAVTLKSPGESGNASEGMTMSKPKDRATHAQVGIG